MSRRRRSEAETAKARRRERDAKQLPWAWPRRGVAGQHPHAGRGVQTGGMIVTLAIVRALYGTGQTNARGDVRAKFAPEAFTHLLGAEWNAKGRSAARGEDPRTNCGLGVP